MSTSADLFITPDKVWPDGQPPAEDVARLFLRRRSGPFSTFTAGDGSVVTVWTTFGEGEISEQIDLDLRTQAARDLVTRSLSGLASHGASMVRLDAVGYVVKKPGTSSFMVEPEIYEFLDWITGVATGLGLTLLPEIHASRATHDRLTALGHWTYDFVLPGLLLHSIATSNTDRLVAHLASSPAKQVTTLDCHDGIPVQPDLAGVLSPVEMRRLADIALDRGGNINRILSPLHATDGIDVHQLNLTYFAAVGEDEDRYVLARAIQLFARGIPQVYYVGLLAGSNDIGVDGQARDGRAINRHNYSTQEVDAALRRPVVQRLLSLVRLRNEHPAFAGELTVSGSDSSLRMRWEQDAGVCELDADLTVGTCVVGVSGPDGVIRVAA
jgi:sucrose 6(F)-phosphate phosphorylase